MALKRVFGGVNIRIPGVSGGPRYYAMPDGTGITTRPKKGDMFRTYPDPYHQVDWIWDDEKLIWVGIGIGSTIMQVHEAIKKIKGDSGPFYSAFDPNVQVSKDPKCTCGCWVTYGKDFPIERHPSHCKLHDGVVELQDL